MNIFSEHLCNIRQNSYIHVISGGLRNKRN